MTQVQVPHWDEVILLASRVRVGVCEDSNVPSVGIDLHAADGTVFAHAHFDPATARDVISAMWAAVVEAEGPQ